MLASFYRNKGEAYIAVCDSTSRYFISSLFFNYFSERPIIFGRVITLTFSLCIISSMMTVSHPSLSAPTGPGHQKNHKRRQTLL